MWRTLRKWGLCKWGAMHWTVTASLIALLLTAERRATAEPNVIRLSCDGTVTEVVTEVYGTNKPKPIRKIVVVVNLDERTVSFEGYVAPIKAVDAGYILFDGTSKVPTFPGFKEIEITGNIDRVESHVDATTIAFPTDPTHGPYDFHYDVLCKAMKTLRRTTMIAGQVFG
jgi:copper chaperone CopZ